MMEIDLLGAMAIWGVKLNAVSVVNLLMGIGVFISANLLTTKQNQINHFFLFFVDFFFFVFKLGFCVHISYAFTRSTGTKDQRSCRALIEMSSSVFQGVTATKLVGVVVMGLSQSLIFRVNFI